MAHANFKNQYNPPDTNARTSHSLTLVANGVKIGLINNWNPQQSRTITPIYEINSETSGLPLENIPGNVTGLTISVSRYDLWTSRMEQAFGTVDLTMLSNQQAPIAVEEYWISPTGGTEVWRYEGVWFSNIGRTFKSDDNRIVNVNATLSYVYRTKVQSA